MESARWTSPSHSSLSVSTCTTSLRGRDGVYSLHQQEYPNIIVYIWLGVRNEEYRDGITLRANDTLNDSLEKMVQVLHTGVLIIYSAV